ncbi:hypothetical protein Z517_06320 [Fonsecaea pedrosoi CBS 271.37]|uniref:Uncharacterized protein n=1 Tax=Fonsecaea pedrosoi CBS 271.37 TaxID=1442368 RepID=A0A0D2DPN3_9EURO|nr:uncharacterized protein Z517_06320 [Fonsecaea pedrosoi CBS 271.37]KIW79706.1 hypothetical protein Z517_06320 [Fonsecaea pedrosoi CBS 271.37]
MAAAVLSHPDSLLLEADFLQARSEILQSLSGDIRFAAKVLDYKVYNMEKRIIGLRKVAWEARSKINGRAGDAVLDGHDEQDERRLKSVLRDARTSIESAQQVKQALTEVVCGRPEAAEGIASVQELTEERHADVWIEKVSKMDLRSFQETLLQAVPRARPVFVHSSGFIPVNFHAMSSQIPNQENARSDKICRRSQNVKQTPLAGEQAITKTKVHRRRGRDNTRGRKVGVSSHVELHRRSKVDNRSRSPAACRQAEKQQVEGKGDLLG